MCIGGVTEVVTLMTMSTGMLKNDGAIKDKEVKGGSNTSFRQSKVHHQ